LSLSGAQYLTQLYPRMRSPGVGVKSFSTFSCVWLRLTHPGFSEKLIASSFFCAVPIRAMASAGVVQIRTGGRCPSDHACLVFIPCFTPVPPGLSPLTKLRAVDRHRHGRSGDSEAGRGRRRRGRRQGGRRRTAGGGDDRAGGARWWPAGGGSNEAWEACRPPPPATTELEREGDSEGGGEGGGRDRGGGEGGSKSDGEGGGDSVAVTWHLC